VKLSSRDAKSYFRAPDPRRPGILLYGPDAMRVAARRHEILAALVGPEGETEMRLTRLAAADLRKDKAALIDALKAQGFFPGQRAVHVGEATDGLAEALSAALEDWAEGDAHLVVTAGQLSARSALRKLFEAHGSAYAAAIYDDPPDRDEIGRMLRDAGLASVSRDAEEALMGLGRDLPPGDFRQTLEKLALYKHGDPSPASADEVALVAPLAPDADLDDLMAVVGEGERGSIGPGRRRVAAQGMLPVTLCLGAERHFRQLHQAASDPGGAGSGVARLRPPVFGPRRDRIVRQAQRWGMYRLETALELLLDADLELRSASSAPQVAVIERVFIRLAILGARAG